MSGVYNVAEFGSMYTGIQMILLLKILSVSVWADGSFVVVMSLCFANGLDPFCLEENRKEMKIVNN